MNEVEMQKLYTKNETEKRKKQLEISSSLTPGCGVVVINTVWMQFSSHGKLRLRPFAANISKVNQS